MKTRSRLLYLAVVGLGMALGYVAATGGPGKGGTGTLFVNGGKVAEGRIERTQGFIFSADEGADVGQDGETPVTDDYKEGDNKFTGKIQKVVIEIGPLKLGAADLDEMRRREHARKAAE